jgi:hypothetical protein
LFREKGKEKMSVVWNDYSYQRLAEMAKEQWENYDGDDPVEKYWRECCYVSLKEKAEAEKVAAWRG